MSILLRCFTKGKSKQYTDDLTDSPSAYANPVVDFPVDTPSLPPGLVEIALAVCLVAVEWSEPMLAINLS